MNCWMTKTPFQMGLILTLIVAVPFLIAMIATYVVYGVVSPKSERCDLLCCFLDKHPSGRPHTSRRTSTISSIDLKIVTTRNKPNDISSSTTKVNRFDDEKIEVNSTTNFTSKGKKPFRRSYITSFVEDIPMVSLLEDLYQDDEDQVYKCPGVVVSSGWILTTARCVKSGVTSVRLGSKYWSKYGMIRYVRSVHDSGSSLALISVEEATIKKVAFAEVEESEEIYSFSWSASMNLPFHKRKKYQEMVSRNVGYQQNVPCGEEVEDGDCYVSKSAKCEPDQSGVMLNENGYLVGFHVGTLCPKGQNYSVVLYVDVHEYIYWIYHTIENKV